MTFGDYAADLLASRVHRDSTAARVGSDRRVHVIPRLRLRPIGGIRHSELQGFVKALTDVLAPGTVENVHRAVSACSAQPSETGSSPSTRARAWRSPARPRAEVVPPTVEEVRALLDAMPDRYRVLGVLAAGVGLRQGEALG